MKGDIKQARLMFDKAGQDLKSLSFLVSSEVSEEIFGFHAQQAVEKYRKCLICLTEKNYPLSHDLVRLSNIAGKYFELANFADLVLLTPYSVLLRYEELGFEKSLDRNKVIERVTLLKEFVSSKLDS